MDGSTPETAMASASAPEGSLAIVFTDIVKSTDIWESSPTAMTKAMMLHDAMIRELTIQHLGYEVKQNGDGFMIAFQTAVAALEFCLDVQKKLMEIEWPEELLELKAGSEVRRGEKDEAVPDGADVLWRGLRLRMSAHFGEPVCMYNSVIDRMDYLGPMVNRAARFIQATEGGQIVVSDEFLTELRRTKENGNGNSTSSGESGAGPLFDATPLNEANDEVKLDLKDLPRQGHEHMPAETQFEIRVLGEREFKGVEEMQKLYFIIPYSLRGRMKHWPKSMQVPGSKGNLVG